ncbi:ATP-binding protein [Bradyrhizobium sp. STM 3562]|uniref:ATP-binding protein n=1 Tax=Bradyrhizobium sp. STM 3562 TaxID=578924 RepID=UPI003890BCDC
MTAVEALKFPAVRLFVERAAATLDGFELSDAEAAVVAGICRKLDGIALAIELMATHVDALGLRGLSTLIDDRVYLLRHESRSALSRHRSLSAALDWSYEFLPEQERIVLRRLSVFVGAFTLDVALGVSGFDMDSSVVIDSIANLVAKSLVSADVTGANVQHWLLDITRAYASQKLSQSGELETVLRRHAMHRRDSKPRLIHGPE